MTAVVDGNVSGRGCARRRVVAVAVYRFVDLRAAERGAEGVDDVSLEAESDVGVDGGAEGAVGYGTSCAGSEEGCSVSGAAKAASVGAAFGGLFGAAAGRFGPKSKGCTPHSFTGSTGVLLANAATKPISEIKVGDWVLTAEPGKKKKEKHRVKEVIVTKTDRNYVDVVVDTKAGPKAIQTTKHHQFYEITRNAWTQAGALKTGQKLQNGEGAGTKILKVKSYTAQRVTYDLSIEGLHTYHVLAGDIPVLVHNCTSGGDDAAEEMIRMRHYTNARGKAGIVQSKVIRASDQNKVFLVPARGKPMSPRDAEAMLGIGRGRGNHVLEFDVPAGRVRSRHNSTMGITEWVADGDLAVENIRVKR
jgi:hypothetical protein